MFEKVLYGKIPNRIYYFLFRNQIGLDRSIVNKNQINLEWWQRTTNLGDALAPIIYEWILRKYHLDKNKRTNKTIHLNTVGSLIGQGHYDAVIWGSGVLDQRNTTNLVNQRKYRKLDVRAVRGPISYIVLKICGYECPQVYGDPAILMPYIYPKKENCQKEYDTSVIFHHTQENSDTYDCHIINIRTKDYKHFIDEICKSKKIISSSLHGIILAETYGVPAIMLKKGMSNEIVKFFDWYYSTSRFNIRMADTLEDAIKMEPMELPNLNKQREELLKAFPYDLWK